MPTKQEKWQEIANRGLQDNFDPDTRSRFDEATRRGLITLPAAAQEPEKEPGSESAFDKAKSFVSAAGQVFQDRNAVKQDLMKGAGRELAGGATFEFADDIEAGARSAFGQDTFRQSREKVQAEKLQFAKENPGLAMASNVGGSMTSGAALGKKLIGGAAKATAKRVAGAAAIEGALVGAGKSNSADEFVGSVASNAALSGVLGFAGTKVVDAGGKLVKKASDFIARRNTPGYTEGIKELGEAILADGKKAVDLEKALKELGDDGVIADIGTKLDAENVSRLTDQAFLQGGPAAQGARKFINKRAKAQVARVDKSIKAEVGDFENYIGKVDAIVQKMRTVAKPAYDAAYAVPISASPDLIKAMTIKNAKGETVLKDAIAAAWRDGQKIANSKGIVLETLDSKTLTTLELDYVKKGLDSVIDSHTNAFGKMDTLGGATAKLKDAFVKEVDKVNPLYATARKAFESEFKLKSALEKGMKAVSDDADFTAKTLAKLSPSEREMFEQGFAKKLRDTVAGAPDTINSYKRIGGSTLKRERITAVLGEERAGRLLADLESEATFHGTRASFGNSKTALREITTGKQKAAQAVEGLSPQALVKKALHAVADSKGSVEQRGNSITKLLFSRGLDQRQVLSELKRFEAAAVKSKSPTLSTLQAAIISASAAQVAKGVTGP